MHDVSVQSKTLRTATAGARLRVHPDTLRIIASGAVPKGDAFSVAKVAAVQAAKNAAAIIPYCHPVPVEAVNVTFHVGADCIDVSVTVKAVYKTGVAMEALTAASVAALTLYDMLAELDLGMSIEGVHLVEQTGGEADFTTRYDPPLKAAVLVMSDSVAAGKKSDASGKLIVERLVKHGVDVAQYLVIPDDADTIVQTVQRYADQDQLDLVVTTGGTGVSPRDTTPEAMRRIFERELPGVAEAVRAHGQERTPFSMLSRSVAGLRGKTVIVALPGSKRGVAESLDALLPGLLHIFKMLRGGPHSPAAAAFRAPGDGPR